MEDRPTLAELKALRVVDLRQKLSGLGLPQSGVKADLIARLDSYYQQMEASVAQAQPIEETADDGVDDERSEYKRNKRRLRGWKLTKKKTEE